MSGPGTIAINGTVSGLLTGSKEIGPLTIYVSNSVARTQAVEIAIGNTAIDIPDDATAVVLVPDSANEAIWKLRGVNGDAGVPISSTLPSVLSVGADPTLVINSDAVSAAEVVWI